MITFNKPFFVGTESKYIEEAVSSLKISGNGTFTQKCHRFFEEKYGFLKVLLTTSCTTALEMIALLMDIKPGDEVIVPSFTFVSTANAFVLRGAKVVFADSSRDNPNIDVSQLEALISTKTKAIVVVHYAGVACDMDALLELTHKHKLYLVEDAAHAIDSFYNGKALGSFGHFAAFSFHETKNISSGEGGMLVINDPKFFARAEVIWEKGTNRASFLRGEVSKYEWMDVGSSFLPSEITAALLFSQLEHLNDIQSKRMNVWKTYSTLMQPLIAAGFMSSCSIPENAGHNAHLFYALCKNFEEREMLLKHLAHHNIQALSHYLPLHQAPYHLKNSKPENLTEAVRYANCIIRFPLYFELSMDKVSQIVACVKEFYNFEKTLST